jgi:cytidylate kinase
VADREGLSVQRALADNDERQRVERARYLAVYAIDMADLWPYDLVLDSGELRPGALTDRVIALVRQRFAPA